MLILTRRIGEAIFWYSSDPEDMENLGVVHMLGYKKGQIRLGFDSPKSVNIVRTELLGNDRQYQLFRQVFDEK